MVYSGLSSTVLEALLAASFGLELGFDGFLWSFLSWKWGQTLGKLFVINQIVAIWGQELLFDFLDCQQRQWSCFLQV